MTVAWPERKLILDCKYYHEALVSRYDAMRFHSGNLYQINAYLTNKAVEPGWENVEGMLLYPSNGYCFDHAFTLHGRHRLRVVTLDLGQPWPAIEAELRRLLRAAETSLRHPDPPPWIQAPVTIPWKTNEPDLRRCGPSSSGPTARFHTSPAQRAGNRIQPPD